MNLLDKIWFGLLIFTTLAIFSCEDATDIGLGLDPDGLRVNVLYEEIVLDATEIFVDSLRTSDGQILIGRQNDVVFGTITSSSYTQIQPANGLQGKNDSLIYVIDSTVLYLDVQYVHVEDSRGEHLVEQSYSIYQLTDTLYRDPYYLSNFDVPYNTDRKEGEFSFLLDTAKINKIDEESYILGGRMEDFVGAELFEIVQGPSAATDLKNVYKGLAIVPSSTNTALLVVNGFDSTSVRVFYHIADPYLSNGVEMDSVITDSLSLNFSLSSGGAFFNHIDVDRSSAVFGSIVDESKPLIALDASDDYIYLHPISGIYPKVDLSLLLQFLEQHENIQINRMELEFESLSSPSNYVEVVDDLKFYFIGGDNTDINHLGLATNVLNNTNVLTDNAYITSSSQGATVALKETGNIFNAVPTLFGQLLETQDLEVSHLLLMPSDMNSPKFGKFSKSTGVKVRLYYTLPE